VEADPSYDGSNDIHEEPMNEATEELPNIDIHL